MAKLSIRILANPGRVSFRRRRLWRLHLIARLASGSDGVLRADWGGSVSRQAARTRGPTSVLNDVIPSHASFPRQKTLGQFEEKVLKGAPIAMSPPGVISRGRMPVFAYLTESEVASAYSYLITYPPR
jgi:hypothetical protein